MELQRPVVVRKSNILSFLALTMFGVCNAEPVRQGLLMGGIPGANSSSPKEGDIKLRDPKGHWYLVQGARADLKPYTSESITIAVIDSGILPDHPQLKGHISEQRDFTGEGLMDRIGHGTLVTIITLLPYSQLSAEERSKIPTPRIIEAKVSNADGTIDKNAVIYAIQWAIQEGAKVVNLSLGFREGSDDYSGLCDIIAKSSQTVFVAAAGNYGPSVKVFPATCKGDNVIPVAAANPDGTIASYSGEGLLAPGTVILAPSEGDP